MKLNKYIEHTVLKPNATSADIQKMALDAIKYDFLGVCVNPNYIELTKSLLDGTDIKLVTVVNFPLANNTINMTLYQTELALKLGADEIDTVLNISALKDKNYSQVESDIQKTKQICGENNLKVILETDLLTREEIETACKLAISAGANFVKTSTGFTKGGVGARVEDVKLMHKIVSPCGLKVKASGGIKTYNDALNLINAGATRLGTSSGVDIILEEGK